MACGPLGDEARVVERPKRARTALLVKKLTLLRQLAKKTRGESACCRRICRYVRLSAEPRNAPDARKSGARR